MQMHLCITIGIAIKSLFFCFILLVGCVHGTTGSNEVNSFIKNFSKTTQARNGVTFQNIGLSFPNDTINLIDVSFYSNGHADIETAREMIVRLTEDFVCAYRANPGLAPLLPSVANPRDGVLVRISYEGKVAPEELSSTPIIFVFFNKNQLVYFTPSKGVISQRKVLEEPYSEAYEKVMGTPLNHKM